MITNQHFEKLRLQGAPELQTPSNSVDAKQGEVHLFGNTPGFIALNDLGTSFAELYEVVSRSGKPALDLGASHSPLACEAFFHGFEVVSSDLQASASNRNFAKNIETALERVRPLYQGREVLPGFYVDVMSDKRWGEMKRAALDFRLAHHITCSAQNILDTRGERAMDRSYSVVLSHNAVPLYSPFERFLQSELPELLRVADSQVRLFPFVYLDSFDQNKKEFQYSAPTESQLGRVVLVSESLGFTLAVSKTKTTGECSVVFTRQ